MALAFDHVSRLVDFCDMYARVRALRRTVEDCEITANLIHGRRPIC